MSKRYRYSERAALALLLRWASNSQGEVKKIDYPTKPIWSHLIQNDAPPRDDRYDICEEIVLRGTEEEISIVVHYFGYLYHVVKKGKRLSRTGKKKLPGLVHKVMKANSRFSPSTARIRAVAETVIDRVSKEAFTVIAKQGDSYRD